MAPMKHRLLQDRAMRDAARQVVDGDLSFIKIDVKQKGVASRVAETGGDYARSFADEAIGLASNNRAIVGGGIAIALAGIAAWAFRDPIIEVIDGFLEGSEDDGGDDADASSAENGAEPDPR